MKIKPRRVRSKSGRKREMLREFFMNAISLALAKEAVLVPVSAEIADGVQCKVPGYYRG